MASLNETLFGSTPLDLIHEWFGESITYTARGAAPGSSIQAVKTDLPDNDESVRRRWQVKKDDVTSPARGDLVTDSDGAIWVVEESFSPAADYHTVDTQLSMDAD